MHCYQILVTSGAQQGIRILTELLLRERRPALLEEVVYAGLTTAIASYDPEIRVVGSDSEDGLDADDHRLQLDNDADCAFLYLVPDAQNPSGTSLPVSTRHRIVELAARYEVPIVEGDPYGVLVYDGDPRPPLRALDADWVFYLGSFSKIISPALRLGWMVVPAEIVTEVDHEGRDRPRKLGAHAKSRQRLPRPQRPLRAYQGTVLDLPQAP